MSLPGYDAWLERPYVEAAKQAEAYESYCERNDLDPDDEATEAAFDDWLCTLGEDDGPDPDEMRDRIYEEERGLR